MHPCSINLEGRIELRIPASDDNAAHGPLRLRSASVTVECPVPHPERNSRRYGVSALEATVRAHAQKGGFPANKVARVRSVIDPTTAEAA
jgi:hypothetical protein